MKRITEANVREEREREREEEGEKGRKCIAKYRARSGSDIYLSGVSPRLAPRFQPVIVISFARLMYTRSLCVPFVARTRRSSNAIQTRAASRHASRCEA